LDWTLKPRKDYMPPKGPVVIVVMDGIAIGKGDQSDAVARAHTPVLDDLQARFPWRTLRAHGTAVGLPFDSDMGNSEVGHNAIGAGRVFDQGAKLVNKAIAEGTLFEGEAWQRLTRGCLERKAPLHLIGLLSDGNVHSHIDHLLAIIRQAAAGGILEVYVHPLLDGRDVDKASAHLYIERLEQTLSEFDGAEKRRYRIASGGGRMTTTMDRYRADWSVVERGWNAHVHGKARAFHSALEAVETYRNETDGIIDQDLPAFVIVDENEAPVGPIRDGASVIFFNFRGDRAIEISLAFEEDEFPFFDRGERPKVDYAGMTQYDGDLLIPKSFLVPPPAIDRTMGEYLSRNGVAQLACSETQKYGHVTYFWNGNRSGTFDAKMETYIEIPSDRVPFEQRPWMKSAEITDRVIEELQSGRYRHGRVNYPNGDMVGHTGNLDSAIYAVEAVDLALGRLLEVIAQIEGVAIVTADHGNADDMYERDKTGGIKVDKDSGRPRSRTSHSLNPVPFVIYDPRDPQRGALRDDLPDAGLANIAATALNLLGFEAPQDYEASLLR
jgi:2,3-bisphosphoglycerate-independent phosphoglycerate mutase